MSDAATGDGGGLTTSMKIFGALSLLDRGHARLCLSLIHDYFGSFQRMYGRIKPRHVSGVIFDQRPGPSVVKSFESHRHLKKDRATSQRRLLIFLNHLGGYEGLEFDTAGFQPGAADEASCR